MDTIQIIVRVNDKVDEAYEFNKLSTAEQRILIAKLRDLIIDFSEGLK